MRGTLESYRFQNLTFSTVKNLIVNFIKFKGQEQYKGMWNPIFLCYFFNYKKRGVKLGILYHFLFLIWRCLFRYNYFLLKWDLLRTLSLHLLTFLSISITTLLKMLAVTLCFLRWLQLTIVLIKVFGQKKIKGDS